MTMKTSNQSVVKLLCLVALALTAVGHVAGRTCHRNCSGYKFAQSCNPDCKAGADCYYEMFPDGYWANGFCDIYSPYEADGCSDGFVFQWTNSKYGTCATSPCFCQYGVDTPWHRDWGTGQFCWLDCCVPE
jgi:hypothetical protein